MLGLVAALGDDPVDPLAGLDVLAQGGHVHVAEHRRVERVATPCGEGGGVGGLAVVGDVRLVEGDDVHGGRSASAGGPSAAASTPAKPSAVDQRDLAPAALLGRRADDHTRPPSSSASAAAARPAPSPAAAMTLWPQAWPMPGRASYSHTPPRGPGRARPGLERRVDPRAPRGPPGPRPRARRRAGRGRSAPRSPARGGRGSGATRRPAGRPAGRSRRPAGPWRR